MNNPLINPGLGTLVWMLISFGILVFILAKWGWPMLLKALKDREEEIDRSLDAAKKARLEVEMVKNNSDEMVRQAKAERDAILSRAQEQGAKIIEEAHKKAEAEVGRMRESAMRNIENEKQRAMHDVKNEIATAAIDMAEKLLHRELADRESAVAFVKSELSNL